MTSLKIKGEDSDLNFCKAEWASKISSVGKSPQLLHQSASGGIMKGAILRCLCLNLAVKSTLHIILQNKGEKKTLQLLHAAP